MDCGAGKSRYIFGSVFDVLPYGYAKRRSLGVVVTDIFLISKNIITLRWSLNQVILLFMNPSFNNKTRPVLSLDI